MRRKQPTREFKKTSVVLQVLREEIMSGKTAEDNDLNTNQIRSWKRELAGNVP